MFNIKWSMISGIIALIFAFVTSLALGNTSLLTALFRALGFAVLFFSLAAGIWIIINKFVPELLVSGMQDDDAVKNVFSTNSTGAQVNITLDDIPNAALPSEGEGSTGADEIDNISDLAFRPNVTVSDIDQNLNKSYTSLPEEFPPAFGSDNDSGMGTVSMGDFSMDFGAFFPDSSDEGTENADSADGSLSLGSGDYARKPAETHIPERKVSGNQPKKLEGDFSPKEIASGLRTVLEKDKKG